MERAEFERLALDQLDAVYRMALQLTRRPEEAEDLVQDVYVRALNPRAIERFEDRTGPDGEEGRGMRAWLFTIAHHSFYSKLKRSRLAPTAMGEFYDAASAEPLPDEPPPAWDLASLDWEQVDERLKAAIDRLRADYRQILLMWGVQGLKYREIAEILDIPIGTVMSRLHRARKILSDELGGEEGPAAELGWRMGDLGAAAEGADPEKEDARVDGEGDRSAHGERGR